MAEYVAKVGVGRGFGYQRLFSHIFVISLNPDLLWFSVICYKI